jgi:hypothetical protein
VDGNTSAWSFGGSMITFVFPMILFIAVAAALYVLYTKPEIVPGRRGQREPRSMSDTNTPRQPPADGNATTAGAGE